MPPAVMRWAEKVEAPSLQLQLFANSVADGQLTKEPWVRGSVWRMAICPNSSSSLMRSPTS
jgi:hypothetical protein